MKTPPVQPLDQGVVDMKMRLKRHDGAPEETLDVSSFREEGRGVRVYDASGRDLGYFGPEEYYAIILGTESGANAPENEPGRRQDDS
jgi:hypothetical protein